MKLARLLQEMLKLPDGEFLPRVYEEIVGRQPDQSDLQRIIQLQNSGVSRLDVIMRILQGQEAGCACFGPFLPPRCYTRISHWDHPPYSGLLSQGALYQPYISSTYPVSHMQPKGIEPDVHWKFADHSLVPELPQYIVNIPGGRVFGKAGDIISPDNKLVAELSVDYILGSPRHEALFVFSQMPAPIHLPETVAVIANGAAHNYYHWMLEVVARFHLLRYSQVRIDKYVINRLQYPFQIETIGALGIPKEQLIELDETTYIEAKSLIVPSFSGYTGKPPKWAGEFLAQEMMVKRGIEGAAGYDRIYISRGYASYRKVANEFALIQLLMQYGFRTVHLERLSVAEQAAVFNGAKVVVAPHGAGLTNLVFCRPGTKVIELFSPLYVNWLYWIMSGNHGLDYYYLVGEGMRPQGRIIADNLNANIQVNLYNMKLLLEKAIGGV